MRTDYPPPYDLRRKRAEALAAGLFSEIRDYIADRNRRDVYVTMIETMMRDGVEVVTDGQRAEAGLPPRGRNGMTNADLFALEQARLKAIYAPMVLMTDGSFTTIDREAGARGQPLGGSDVKFAG